MSILRKLLCADDLAVIADGEADLYDKVEVYVQQTLTESKSGEDKGIMGLTATQWAGNTSGGEQIKTK